MHLEKHIKIQFPLKLPKDSKRENKKALNRGKTSTSHRHHCHFLVSKYTPAHVYTLK